MKESLLFTKRGCLIVFKEAINTLIEGCNF